jgi:hypothetical protein
MHVFLRFEAWEYGSVNGLRIPIQHTASQKEETAN